MRLTEGSNTNEIHASMYTVLKYLKDNTNAKYSYIRVTFIMSIVIDFPFSIVLTFINMLL